MRKVWLPLAVALLLAGCAAAEVTPPAETAAVETAAPASVWDAAPSEEPAAETPAPSADPAPAAPEAAAPAGEADALAIALKEAGLTGDEIRAPLVKRDREDGTEVFEVEFYVPSQRMEYEFEIDAGTGAVREQKSEGKGIAAGGDAGILPEADILAKVLEKVPGASEKDAALYLEKDDGKLVYEGVVRYDGMEYEFEADPWTGAILEWEKEAI